MIELIKVTTADSRYGFIENLLHDSFPETERRDDDAQRFNTDNNPLFTAFLIIDKDSNANIGLITVWNLGGFYYVEHLATSPDVRNRGYGNKIIQALSDRYVGSTIVLEVEMPEDDLSRRRIGFYERNGFVLCTNEYVQPPYRANGSPVPMYLMSKGEILTDDKFEAVKSAIHRNVYGVS